MRLLALALVSSLLACVGTPSGLRDAAGERVLPDVGGGGQLELVLDRPFGAEGELPAHLVPAGDRLLAVTDSAVYLLGRSGRVLQRQPLPTTTAGSVAVLTSAAWDGSGLGAVVRWGHDPDLEAGSYLALTDGRGIFSPSGMLHLGSAASVARSAWDRVTRRHLVLVAERKNELLDLSLRSIARDVAPVPATPLLGLPVTTTVGGWAGPASRPALCTVEPTGGGRVMLRTFPGGGKPGAVDVTDPGRTAVGSCGLAVSEHSHLVTWVQRALPPDELDAGPAGRVTDLGPGSLSYDVPVAQLVDPLGAILPRSLRLSFHGQAAVAETVLWDGQRFLVLVRTDHRGGRLLLTAIDATGLLLARDLELPLTYEPGTLLGARLALDAAGDCWLLYARRRPEDGGVLHLARFTLRLGP